MPHAFIKKVWKSLALCLLQSSGSGPWRRRCLSTKSNSRSLINDLEKTLSKNTLRAFSVTEDNPGSIDFGLDMIVWWQL